MYSFQVLKNGWYLPVCHFLLPNKKESTYVTMLHMLKTESSLILKNVMLDFEVGMLNALRKVYPGIHLRGCSVGSILVRAGGGRFRCMV